MNGVLDDMEDNPDYKDPIIITVEKEEDNRKKLSPEQLAQQKKIKEKIKDFFLRTLGGIPKGYKRVEVKRIFDSSYRVNLQTVDKNGNTRYPHSAVLHYLDNEVIVDKHSPITKTYNNYGDGGVDDSQG